MSSAMPSRAADPLPGRCRSGRKLAQRTLAVARDRRPLLAVDNERMIIQQYHAYLVLDLDVRAKWRGSSRRRKMLATARSSAGGVFTRKTDLPDVPSLGLTTTPSGCAFSRPSIASRDPDPGTCSLSFAPKNSVCGCRARRQAAELPRQPPCHWRSGARRRCSARRHIQRQDDAAIRAA